MIKTTRTVTDFSLFLIQHTWILGFHSGLARNKYFKKVFGPEIQQFPMSRYNFSLIPDNLAIIELQLHLCLSIKQSFGRFL